MHWSLYSSLSYFKEKHYINIYYYYFVDTFGLMEEREDSSSTDDCKDKTDISLEMVNQISTAAGSYAN